MSSNKSVFPLILCFALICAAGFSYAAVEQLTSKWASATDDGIKAIGIGDVNGDNVSEIVAADSHKVYVFSAAGSLLKTYPVNFSVSAIYVGDIDGDGLGEILLGSGYMETRNLSVERFDFTDKNNIHEKPEITYEVTRNLGDVYMIKYGAKEPVNWLSVGEWVRDIKADDLNGDGSVEVIVASGGDDTDYIEKVTTGTDPDTGNATYIRNYTENHYENGSIMVFSANRSLAVSYHTNNTLWYVYPTFLQKAGGEVLVSGSTDIFLRGMNGTVASTFKSLDSNYTIENVFSDKISQDKANEFVVWFSSPAVEGVYLLDLDGIMLWQYRSLSRNLRGVYSANLDIDTGKEVVIAAPQNIYVLDGAGKLKWSYVLPVTVDHMIVTSLGNNTYTDFVMSSGNQILVYETGEKFLKAQLAAEYYQEARDNYDAGKYPEALANLTSAKDIYSQLSDQEGITAVDALFLTVNSSIKDVRKDTALSLYKKGRSEYYLGNYTSASEYLLTAKEIYTEVGDSNGTSNCDELLNEIAKEEETQPTTTSPGSSTTQEEESTTTQPGTGVTGQSISPLVLGLAAIIIVLLAVYGIKQVKSRKTTASEKSSGKKPSESEESMDAISIAVSKSEDAPRAPEATEYSFEKKLGEFDEESEQKASPADSTPPSSEDLEKTASPSEPVIEKPLPSPQPSNNKKLTETKPIPLEYNEDKKEEKKGFGDKEKTQETGSDTSQ